MWVYRLVKDTLAEKSRRAWEVGYYYPAHRGTGVWSGTTQYPDERDAMRAVHYLNGGDGMPVAMEVEELD